jgi:hypothetical protein
MEQLSSPPVLVVFVLLELWFSVLLCRSLLFFWSLYCLSFVHLRLLINPLVSSNFSCIVKNTHTKLFLDLHIRNQHSIMKMNNQNNIVLIIKWKTNKNATLSEQWGLSSFMDINLLMQVFPTCK